VDCFYNFSQHLNEWTEEDKILERIIVLWFEIKLRAAHMKHSVWNSVWEQMQLKKYDPFVYIVYSALCILQHMHFFAPL
jgi:hypothetical protein